MKTATPEAITEYMQSVQDQHLSHNAMLANLEDEFDAIPFIVVLTEIVPVHMTGSDTVHFFCTDPRNYGSHVST